ncbi:hypothetical protein UFOVP53_75 [uncultured Caudovirales phage]|uniref:Uncharacterized protein n=1 Tax=uncultured Caudovirales phage TaxID=2100421 RepID=A0A6J5KY77_9CAUD|nr:hypothetical protein UFOVP53_75 [uncultured Caudovirales phage]
MKLSKIINPKFKDLLRKLATSEVPVKTAVKLKTISQAVEKALTDYETVRVAIINKHAELNESGEPKADENNNAIFSSPESKIEFGQELSDVLNLDIDLDVISIDDLGDVVLLSAFDLVILEDILQ